MLKTGLVVKKQRRSTIRGTLRSENELRASFIKNGFEFHSYDIDNGALLDFKAIKG
jgi:hypothetical protein